MNYVENDAVEFGVHVKQGGWRLGLLVARNVAPSARDGKISLSRFAELSGTHRNRVARYLEAWESAAMDGRVPAAAEIQPGVEVPLDADKLPDWADYYRPISGGPNGSAKRPPTRVEARQSLEALNEEATRATVAALSPEAKAKLAEAVEADTATRIEVAKAGLRKQERIEDATREARKHEFPGSVERAEWWNALRWITKTRLDYARALQAIRVIDLDQVQGEQVDDLHREIGTIHDWYGSYIDSGSRGFDAELEAILQGEDA